jgi:ubiquinone/menaquinone biosynthesis C-methylase UbiE
MAKAMYTDPITKIMLPSEGEIESAIPSSFDDNPFETLDKSSFSRLDQTADSDFYKNPRFTEHVDDNAVQILTRYISQSVLKPNDAVLDLCSSWTSHIDKATAAEKELNLKRVAGLGMNPEELQANSVLTDYTVVDLNAKPDVKLPYDDSVFDVVLCQLSIDYLIYPLNVLKEVGRVLKPGGKVVILFSNRLFIQKVRLCIDILYMIGLWTPEFFYIIYNVKQIMGMNTKLTQYICDIKKGNWVMDRKG